MKINNAFVDAVIENQNGAMNYLASNIKINQKKFNLALKIFWLLLISLLILFSGCTNQDEKRHIIYGLEEGSIIANTNENGNIEWKIDKNVLKGYLMQLVYQISIQTRINPDTLISKGFEITKEELDNKEQFHLCAYYVLDNKQTLTLSLGLKKDGKNNLILDLDKVESGNKTIEGCLGNNCSQCKLSKKTGCSCNTNGSCNHIIIEIPIL